MRIVTDNINKRDLDRDRLWISSKQLFNRILPDDTHVYDAALHAIDRALTAEALIEAYKIELIKLQAVAWTAEKALKYGPELRPQDRKALEQSLTEWKGS